MTPASAADDCPNAVFRTGPGAKLPDCRAYELVSPAYTGGVEPTFNGFSGIPHSFSVPPLTAAGDSVIFNTNGGALSVGPGTGFTDRYQSKRTPAGWVTELVGPTAAQSPVALPGGTSADHQYYFLNAGGNPFLLEPEATLQAPFGGGSADYLHKPNGEFELIAKGSLGTAQNATGRLITPGGDHVIFTTREPIEPNSPPAGKEAIYDRSADGPTHLVSVLPGEGPNGLAAELPGFGDGYLGASLDGEDIAFRYFGTGGEHYVVRHENSETIEYARANAVQVGRELTCQTSPPGPAEFQWLRNGTPIAGADDASYTVTSADAGKVVQCEASRSLAGENARSSVTGTLIVAPFVGKNPPRIGAEITAGPPPRPETEVEVGQELSCKAGGSGTATATFTYQWLKNRVAIAGATTDTYIPVAADKEAAIQCKVTGTNADGTAVSVSVNSPTIVAATPHLSATPAISNTTDPGNAPAVGDELSCAPGTWTNSPSFAYQWLRNGAEIGSATASTYPVTAADEGTVLQCLVTASNSEGKAVAVSNQLIADPQPGTTPPEPGGSPGYVYGTGTVGESLFCEEGFWSGEPTIAFQWLRDGVQIAGATTSSYTVEADDRGKTIECAVTATNAGGSVLAIDASRARYGRPMTPEVSAQLEGNPGTITYAGIFGGQLFYGDGASADLFSFDIASRTTTRITDVGDARFSHVSNDGSHVYFVSESQIGGEGSAGDSNLYVWSRSDESTKFIATVNASDGGLRGWAGAVTATSGGANDMTGPGTRSNADGSVFLFETTTQLTSFNNLEAAAEDCGEEAPPVPGNRCSEIYRYDTASEELTCVSCPEGAGRATGEATLYQAFTTVEGPKIIPNLNDDGSMAFFESSEDLLSEDGNEHVDVYRWKEGEGLALISRAQTLFDSHLWGVTPSGSDVTFITREQLLPEDRNGGTRRIYDARINGGFPPPEDTVTEPCSGDSCQGAAQAAPEAPQIASSSLVGAGNVAKKLRCGKAKRRAVRKGRETCVKRRTRHRHKRHAHAKRGASR